MDEVHDEEVFVLVLHEILDDIRVAITLFLNIYKTVRRPRLGNTSDVIQTYSLKSRMPWQIRHMRYLVGHNNIRCRKNLRMNIDAFNMLCFLVENIGGLRPTRNVLVPEMVAIFLHTLAHHKKNAILQTNYKRSGYTISKHFNRVMNAVLKLHALMLVEPEPVPVDCENERWKHFKGCLGALDGTYIDVRVRQLDKPRYRNRKGRVSVNVLGVCDRNLNFVFVLTGWEGSAADSRVLRDAITRPNGLRVPTGHYYLVDNGYTNGDGFLAPYRNCRYHLQDFGVGRHAPQDLKEYFNMKHAKARNVIERTFGVLKSRWAILRSASYYPIKVQNRIILACCLLHNFIRNHNDLDPDEARTLEDIMSQSNNSQNHQNNANHVAEFIDVVESSDVWTAWRDDLATNMYNAWLSSR